MKQADYMPGLCPLFLTGHTHFVVYRYTYLLGPLEHMPTDGVT